MSTKPKPRPKRAATRPASTGDASTETTRTTEPSDPQATGLEELRAEIAKLREQQSRAEQDKQEAVTRALAQSRGEQPDTKGTELDLSDLDQSDRGERYADWPEKDGELPQPWNMRALGLHGEMRDFETDARPGSPNTVSPIVVTHGRPILSHGSTDPSVHELGQILGRLGFPNSVSEGRNAFGSVDNSVMAAVHAFRDAYNVQEDPTGWGGNTPRGREDAAAHIGPWTWEAILRAGAQLAAAAV